MQWVSESAVLQTKHNDFLKSQKNILKKYFPVLSIYLFIFFSHSFICVDQVVCFCFCFSPNNLFCIKLLHIICICMHYVHRVIERYGLERTFKTI